MHKKQLQRGFSIVKTLMVAAVLAAIGFGSWLAWHHTRNTPKATTSANATRTTSTTPNDAGWKSYCDTVYHYCFKYPSTWHLAVVSKPQHPCDQGQVELTSPDGTANVNYHNENNHDRAVSDLSVVSVDNFVSAGQDFSIVGGYIPYGAGYLPAYNLADSSLLSTYPVSVGSTSSFPTTASFSDQASNCSGSLLAQALNPADTPTSAKSWFKSSDAQICLAIIKSFAYRP